MTLLGDRAKEIVSFFSPKSLSDRRCRNDLMDANYAITELKLINLKISKDFYYM